MRVRHRRPWTELEKRELKRMFQEHKTDAEIGEKLGRCQRGVEDKRKKMGLRWSWVNVETAPVQPTAVELVVSSSKLSPWVTLPNGTMMRTLTGV